MCIAAIICFFSYFAQIVGAYDFHCNLFCYNGGECRHGHGAFGSYTGVDDDEEMPWEKVRHKNGMYCICPVGYTGLQCEIKMVVCGADDHTCFNGSTCKKDHSGWGESYWRCECDPKGSVMTASYAGKYCEHESTVFCVGDAASHSSSFCTNGGRCKERDNSEQRHAGCDCPAGYEGPHCEHLIKGFSLSAMVHTATSNKSVGSIIGIMSGVVLIVALGLFAKERYIDKPKRDAIRRAHMPPGFGGETSSRKSGRRNNTRDIV
ncbi:EGF-like domain containing protein [Nitzschia inconspicua]|uniref:EGF-like domain containing protein n=1 Tax=Nitzschia inconspicua TaxID=303405 RepID=A0A9K3KLJ3_9STRA|nr:EGF-like domain containing protein [Nitzschia inconspicua]